MKTRVACLGRGCSIVESNCSEIDDLRQQLDAGTQALEAAKARIEQLEELASGALETLAAIEWIYNTDYACWCCPECMGTADGPTPPILDGEPDPVQLGLVHGKHEPQCRVAAMIAKLRGR